MKRLTLVMLVLLNLNGCAVPGICEARGGERVHVPVVGPAGSSYGYAKCVIPEDETEDETNAT